MERVDDDVIRRTTDMAVKCENEDFQGSHGDTVIAMVMKEENGIEKFERRWRQHFLDTMKPQFMPALWSVHHRHKGVDSDTEWRSGSYTSQVNMLYGTKTDSFKEQPNRKQENRDAKNNKIVHNNV